MDKLRVVIILMLFSTFVFSGFLAGRSVMDTFGGYSEGEVATNSANPYPLNRKNDSYPIPNLARSTFSQNDLQQNVPIVPTQQDNAEGVNQENVLVILIDDFQKSKPKIQGMWLILYFTNSSHLTLMPLYPDMSGSKNQNISKIIEQELENKGKLFDQEQTFEALRKKQIWWSGYLIIDRNTVANWFVKMLLANGNPHNITIDINRLAAIPSADTNPKESLREQITILQDFCLSASQQFKPTQLFSLTQSSPVNILTDMDLFQFLSAWDVRIADNGQLSCEFPFLTAE